MVVIGNPLQEAIVHCAIFQHKIAEDDPCNENCN